MAVEQTEAPAKQGKGLLIALITTLMLLVGGAAGGTAWYFSSGDRNAHAAAEPVGEADARKRNRDPKEARIFVPMDQFVVNLNDANLDRYAQVAVVLEVDDSPTENRIKAAMPAVRNEVLLLLSSRSAAELLSLEGKEQLAIDIAVAAHAVLSNNASPRRASRVNALDAEPAPPQRSFDDADTGPIAAVHFSQFIVQ